VDKPPKGLRLILADENLLDSFGTRTISGLRISAEWGEPEPEGWYVPTFTATDDGGVYIDAREQEALRLLVKTLEDDGDCRCIRQQETGHDLYCLTITDSLRRLRRFAP
jgi:hypothetical protein